MSLKMGAVVLENYNKNWKSMYEEEEKKLKDLLKDNILEIKHVGSTSIEGLCAKPVIDIMVTVNKLSDVEKFKHLFTKELGYDFRDDGGEKGEYLVRKGTPDARTHFIHIIEDKSERYENFIYFKNYLEKHPEKIEEYRNLKIDLANKYADDRKSYTASKNDFIQEVIKLYKEENGIDTKR